MSPWLILVLVAALIALAGVAIFSLWRRRRRAVSTGLVRRAPTARIVRKLPVVLVHGLMGFDELRLPGGRVHYFRGVARRLRDLGVDVRVTRVPPVRSIRARAGVLAPQLDAAGPPCIVIAHSMGGLDARYAVARLGVASRVAELVTVASPHRGTPLADLGSAILSRMFLVGPFLERVGLDPAAFHDLTTAHMQRFNAEIADVPGVRYASIVARAVAPLPPLLVPGFAYLENRAGDNDGLVPTSSQRWGDVLAEVDADHFGVIGWSAQFDAAELYIEILRGLGLALPVSAPARRRAKQRLLSAG